MILCFNGSMPKKKTTMQTTNFQLDLETHKKLRIAAIEARVSMGEAIRQAINLWLKQQRNKGGTTRG